METTPLDTPAEIPPGFHAFPGAYGFIGRHSPLYMTLKDGGPDRMGFRVCEDHCNPLGIAHGGWLATFMDMLLPISGGHQAGLDHFMVTISLTVDYLAPAKLGAWVEGEAELLRRTKSMLFVHGVGRVDGQPVIRASGTFKIGIQRPPLSEALSATIREFGERAG